MSNKGAVLTDISAWTDRLGHAKMRAFTDQDGHPWVEQNQINHPFGRSLLEKAIPSRGNLRDLAALTPDGCFLTGRSPPPPRSENVLANSEPAVHFRRLRILLILKGNSGNIPPF